ncbi:MAG: TonB-dependent siderophore receptor [Acidobacteria bacterium]|nr:TonB-dependent siderophore receptor [Acidobacteriota bacterium]
MRRRPPRAFGALGALGALGAVSALLAARSEAAPPAPAPSPSAGAAKPLESAPVPRFDIPPGQLGDVLDAFASVSGLKFTVTEDAIRAIPSPGVSGLHRVAQALEQILAGTGVTYRFTLSTAVTLSLRSSAAAVDVTAPAFPLSSPKYTEPLRDVPQTITVVPRAVIEQQGATTLRDVLRNVSGISIQAGEGGVPNGDNLSIRGFNARTDIFVDGVRDFGGYARDPFNLEQVEIVKGPASSFAGRGSTGGSVNLSTKSPLAGVARTVSLAGGTSNSKRATLDVNQPLGAAGLENAAVRVNAMWTDADTPGRDAVESSRWGVAPSLAFGLGQPTRLTIGYSYLSQDNLPDYGIPWVPGTNTALAAYQDQAPPVDFDSFYGLRSRDYEKTGTGIASVQLDHDFSGSAKLRSLLRYGRTERDSVITAPRFVSNTSTDLTRQLQSRDMTDGVLANQTDLTLTLKTGPIGHAIVSGVELARETSRNYLRSGPAAPVADLFDPNPDQEYAGPIVRTGAVNDGAADSLALYAFDTLKLSEKWEATGGLRWDRFSVDCEATPATGAPTVLERTDSMLSWRAGLVFKPLPSGSVYAGAGTSFNPSAEALTLSAATVALEPESSFSAEIGTKWDLLAARLTLNAAAFRTEKTNARTPGVNPGDAPTVLDGEQTVTGAEVSAAGRVLPGLQIFAGYVFMDSEVKASNTSSEIGHVLGNTPRHSLNLWLSYQLPWELEVGGGASFVGQRLNGNSGARTAPDYWLFDAMASWGFGDLFTLRLNVNNLTNERYIDRVGGGHFVPGAARSASLSAAVRF